MIFRRSLSVVCRTGPAGWTVTETARRTGINRRSRRSGPLSGDSLPAALQVWAGAITAASCLSVVAALLAYLWQMRRRQGGFAGATTLMCVFVLALGVSSIARFLSGEVPGADFLWMMELVVAAVLLGLAIAVWPLVPTLVTQPTRRELIEVNRRLVAEQAARQVVVAELRYLNQELESRVAERTSELEAVRYRFEVALEGTDITVYEQDLDLHYVWVHNPPVWMPVPEVLGQSPEQLIPAETASVVSAMKRQVIETGEPGRFEVSFDTAHGHFWYEGRVEPRLVGGNMVGVLTVAIDITRHKQHEREVRDMLRELTHRSKNLLSVVQSIAHQSRVGMSDIDDFLGAFTARLMTLSVVHELLVDNDWRGALIGDVIRRVRTRTPGALGIACDSHGPDVMLTPELTQNMGLAVHELFVDAVGDGAARIEVAWQHEPGGAFDLDWRASERQGRTCDAFCQRLLQGILPRAVGGTGVLTLESGGLHYHLSAASDRLIVAGAAEVPARTPA